MIWWSLPVSRRERCSNSLDLGNYNGRGKTSFITHPCIAIAVKIEVVDRRFASRLKNSLARGISRASRLTELYVPILYRIEDLKKKENRGAGVIYYLSAMRYQRHARSVRELLSGRPREGSYPARSLVRRITSIIHPPLMIAAASAFVKTYSTFAFVAYARARAW